MKFRWESLLWLVGGLLAAGILFLVASKPRGKPITLQPPPTQAPIFVHVIGAVNQGGIYSLPPDSRVQDAIDAAGGFTLAADPQAINLAAFLQDGEQIVIPTQIPTTSLLEIPITSRSGNQVSIQPSATSAPYENGNLININTASQSELETLPGVGPVTAEKIIAYRESNGPFQTIEEIMDVAGIGPVKFEGMKDLITVQN
jgi:competence protein ComEA